MSVFSESTIEKFREAMLKILKGDIYKKCKILDPEVIWHFYHTDIASDVFYELKDEMHKYSPFEDGKEEYKLQDEFEEELKAIFIQIVQEPLESTSDNSNGTANVEEIIRLAKNMSQEDIKKTISRLLNMI